MNNFVSGAGCFRGTEPCALPGNLTARSEALTAYIPSRKRDHRRRRYSGERN
ncbi:hypothetical protein K466DRAFT_593036, partial [Polyporus arcularius HHB13444]